MTKSFDEDPDDDSVGEDEDPRNNLVEVCILCRKRGDACTCGKEDEEAEDEEDSDSDEEEDEICQYCGCPIDECDCSLIDEEN